MPRPLTLLFTALALGLVPSACTAQLSLSVSAPAVSAGKPVTVTATLSGAVDGQVTVFDNGAPVATVPIEPNGQGMLQLGTLGQGSHLLSAAYTGSFTNFSASTSGAVSLLVMPPNAAFTLAAGATATTAGEPIAFDTVGLPADATGTIRYFDNGQPAATVTLSPVRMARYESFGDSITAGAGVPDPLHSYPGVLGAGLGVPSVNYARNGSVACEMLPDGILRHGAGPTRADVPLYSMMVGTNDADYFRGSPAHDALYRNCHTGALAWLGVPRENKVLAGDAAAQAITGTWTVNAGTADGGLHTLFNAGGSGTARFFLATDGSPAYLWFLNNDHLGGSFTLSVDGVPTGTVYQTQVDRPVTLDGVAIGFDRIPLPAGQHVFEVQVVSGDVGILGFGSAPAQGVGNARPVVLVGDVPHERTTDGLLSDADLDHYARLIQLDLALLMHDGLDLRFVYTRNDLQGLPQQMTDGLHPNAIGEGLLALAYTRVFPYAAATVTGSATLPLAAPGAHTVTAVYSGDARYPGFTAAPVTVTVADVATATTMTASAQRVRKGTAVTWTAQVSPADATGSVVFLNGSTVLGRAALGAGNRASLTTTLPPGSYSVTARYETDLWRPASTSASVPLDVHLQDELTVTSLTVQAGTTDRGTYATLAVNVANGAGVATDGAVTLADSGSVLATLALDTQGKLQYTTGLLAAGSHSFSAQFAGNSRFLPSSTIAAPLSVRFDQASVTLRAPATVYVAGQTVPLTATVTPAKATGTALFFNGSVLLGTAPVVNGQAVLQAANLSVGLHELRPQYSGDTYDTSAQGPSIEVRVVQSATVMTLGSLPSTAPYGSLGALVASLQPGTATGNLTFTDTNLRNGQATTTTLGQPALAAGAASVALAGLAVGTHTLTASYAGDANNLAATASATVEVDALASTLTLTASSLQPVAGAPLTITAALTPVAATGTISLREGTVELARLAVGNGTAQWTSSTFPAGPHTLTAVYLGSDTVAQATATLGFEVVKRSSTTVLGALPATVVVGTPLVLSAAVSPADATGTVTFYLGGTRAAGQAAGQATLSGGTATLTLPTQATGYLTVSAAYAGDATTLPSSAAAATVHVTLNPASVTLSGMPATMPYGTPVTLTASLTPTAATGTVTFLDQNGASLGTVPVSAGLATMSTSQLPLGPHTILAAYSGDTSYQSASSVAALGNVTPDTSSTQLTLAQTQVPAAGEVTFNVSVASSTLDIPTGTVSVQAGGRTVATTALTNGTAGAAYATVSVSAAALGQGSFQAVAYYSGDHVNTLSNSAGAPAAFTVIATPVVAKLAVTAHSVPVGTAVGMAASVTSQTGIPAGPVEFFANGRLLAAVQLDATGQATLPPSVMPLGSYTLTAQFRGGNLFAPAASPVEPLQVTLPVALAFDAAALAATPGSAHDVPLHITPLSGFTGAIQTSCASPAIYLTCRINGPATISGTTSDAPVHIVVSTNRTTSAALRMGQVAGAGVALALLLPWTLRGRRARRLRLLTAMLCGLVLLGLSGCAEGGTFFNVPPGTQTVVVTVLAGGTPVQANLVVTITP